MKGNDPFDPLFVPLRKIPEIVGTIVGCALVFISLPGRLRKCLSPEPDYNFEGQMSYVVTEVIRVKAKDRKDAPDKIMKEFFRRHPGTFSDYRDAAPSNLRHI